MEKKDTYGDTVTLKRHRDDDADKDKEPSAGSDRGSKRRKEGKEPESTSASESATTKEPMQTTFEMEEPSHPEFETGADDQPIIESIIAVIELKIVEWHNYKHLDWITVQRDDEKLYKFKEGDFKRLRIQDIKDMLLLLIQRKLTNLTVEERFAFNNKDKQNRLMRIDELHKFSDGTLTDVRTALDDRLKGIRMKYLPPSIWRKSDKDRVAAMIQAIDKWLKIRRIMRSLERFVGGRLYEGDFRIL
nr:hypothetical protein [Tanacetum cinerariifolium]